MKTRFVFVGLIAAAAGCTDAAKEDAKGQVDESGPPSSPTQLGKSDASQKTVDVDVQSAHPYTNNLYRTYNVPLTDVPWCASTARLHFKVLRTEANYDYVTVVDTGEEFDGIADDTWSGWFATSGLTNARVRLETDGSITRHGFEIDKIEWDGVPNACAPVLDPECAAEEVDLAATPGVCACPIPPVCEDLDDVQVSHHLYRGFNNTTKTVHGGVATFTHPGPADAPETDTIGSIDTAKLRTLVRRAAATGLLHGPGYAQPINWANGTGEDFSIRAGSYEVTFTAMQGSQDPAVQSLIDEFTALFTCGTGGGLTCGSGYDCDQGTCVEAATSCVCTALYDPVCGINGVTYGNACNAGCAQMSVAHDGECGITGDMCGSMMGLTCQDGYKCRFGDSQFSYPYPDASGTCVADTYCDAPVDCNGLPHIAVPGAWACNANACEWQAGAAWTTLDNFSTTNPYANNMSVWHQAYLPAGAQAMRLSSLRFATETNYDKLEVWTWKNGAWTRVRSYTGTVGPALTDEFPGQYHYLKFVSDSSVVKAGVSVDIQYR